MHVKRMSADIRSNTPALPHATLDPLVDSFHVHGHAIDCHGHAVVPRGTSVGALHLQQEITGGGDFAFQGSPYGVEAAG